MSGTALPFSMSGGRSSFTLPGLTGAEPTTLRMASCISAGVARAGRTATISPGRVTLDLPPLIENGNAVPLTVDVASPMTGADHVRASHVFTQKNPQPNVASFHLGPRAGRAKVATRVRLADSQTVVAICELSDGSFWSAGADIVVTLAACLEDGI